MGQSAQRGRSLPGHWIQQQKLVCAGTVESTRLLVRWRAGMTICIPAAQANDFEAFTSD
jgi:hypothetical protein